VSLEEHGESLSGDIEASVAELESQNQAKPVKHGEWLSTKHDANQAEPALLRRGR
jgi:hypothetical protein